MAKLKPVEGAKVRLLRDIQTRGRRKFLAGLQMKIRSTDRCFLLVVYVRTKRMSVQLEKKDWERWFEVLSVPKKPDEEPSDEGGTDEEGS